MATRLQRLRRDTLRDPFPFAGPAFRRAAPWLLAAVAFLGLVTRVHPALRFAVWGSDAGEYLYLTERLVETGRVQFDYAGWGLAYPYFPGMFVVSGAVSAVLGVDVFHAVLWTTPVLAAAIPALVGLIAYRVTSDPRVGIVAGSFVAASAAVVLTTSHAMPATLGQLFMLAILALVPDSYRDRWHWPLLALLGAAMLVTHHLTTYFAVGILAYSAFHREMTQRASDHYRLRLEVPLVLGLLAGAAVWWLGVATPFREEIVGDALPLNPWLTALLFLAGLAALPAIVWFKRQRSDWHAKPHYPSFPLQRLYVMGGFFGVLSIILLIKAYGVPGTNMEITWTTVLYVVPVLGFVAFLPLGISMMRFYKQGVLVLAWLGAVVASLVFAILTDNRVLFPFRHVDYMVMGMAPLIALGMVMVYDQTLASRIPAERASTRANLVVALGLLLAVSALTSLPPRETIGGFEEGITRSELVAVHWVRDHPEAIPPNATFAADHRVSSLLFGVAGVHPTWDYTPATYHSETPLEALHELASVEVPPREGPARIDYVFLSPTIEEGVTLLQWENSRPMSDAAVAKFEDTRYFEKVYDVDDVRIYRVRWDALTPAPAMPEPASG